MPYVIARRSSKGGTRYTGMFRDLTGRARSVGTFTTQARALREATVAESEAAAGRGFDPHRAKQTLRHYVESEWLPHHRIEASTRESYTYVLQRYLFPELGDLRMRDLHPTRVRVWVTRLSEVHGASPSTVRYAKTVFDAICTTALNDHVIPNHPGRGVKTPTVPRKTRRIVTAEQFQTLYEAIDDPVMQLLVETAIESGLRWGELTELRPKDLDLATGMLTVSRAVMYLYRAGQAQFLVKDHPKDADWRLVKLAHHLSAKLGAHIATHGLGPEDLLFTQPLPLGPARRRRPAILPDPATLGFTDPNPSGRVYRHGTLSAYQAGPCRCVHCRDAVATYRAARRAAGQDTPRPPRTVASDGHLSNGWFRQRVWAPALDKAGLGFRLTPHDLRHAHASWLLAGGADLQVVKERLGHASITTTERYLHTLPTAHDQALAALSHIRSTPGPPPHHTEVDTALAGGTLTDADLRGIEIADLRAALDTLTRIVDRLP